MTLIRCFRKVALLLMALAIAPCHRLLAQTAASPSPPAVVPAVPSPAPVPNPAPIATPVAPVAAGALVAAIPFQYVNDKAAVNALINGQGPFSIGIDSGSETLTVTQKVVDTAKLTSTTGTVEVSGTSGGYVPIPQATVDQLKIGDAVVDHPFCTVTPGQIPVDGYLGAPLFNAYVVEIDPGTHTVSLYRPDLFKPDPNDMAVPIELGLHRVPVVRGTIGGVDMSFEVDTGSASPVELGPAIVASKDLTHKFSKIGSVEMLSAHGPALSDVYAMDGLSLGTDAVVGFKGKVPAVFLDPSRPAPDTWDGRIGAPLLRNFVITFDYNHSKMYFRPIAPAQPSTSGVTTAPPPVTAPASTGT